jgi:hypothetical protein
MKMQQFSSITIINVFITRIARAKYYAAVRHDNIVCTHRLVFDVTQLQMAET